MRSFTLSDFDFDLPPELIAQHPAPERTASRLLDGRGEPLADRIFAELPDLLAPGDLLVLNDTQVIKARVFGEKATGGKLEILVERVLADNQVVAHMKVSKKPPVGATLHLAGGAARGGFDARLLGRWPDADGALFRLQFPAEPHELLARHGHIPLPPYIARPQAEGTRDSDEDLARYQTVFAARPGAVAAPTASLHFDQPLLDRLAAMGVARTTVTLHVGAGTFAPVKSEDIAQHQMHSEWYEVPAAAQAAIAACRARGGRVVAVGTTSVRTLESWAQSGMASGDTCIFITPGFRFQLVDLLITNFHLPKSTLMMLVSAFAGHERIRRIYRHAIAQRYRFFSYGDAMLLARASAGETAGVGDAG
jgi:S-adenosylmethionine:tRNA ribosyltransferase-isomerase